MRIDWQKNVGAWAYRDDFLDYLRSPYMIKLLTMITKSSEVVYPQRKNVFRAFRECSPTNLKVVILGQDPYHDGSAIGLAFGNNNEKLRISPSLKKILECVEREFNTLKIDEDITLQSWANQGVLLLNTALTVEKSKPKSHSKPWKLFTEFVVKYIAQNFPGTIFMLWGKDAQAFEKIGNLNLNNTCHVLKAVHPSYANFKNTDWKCDNFKQANKIIEQQNGNEFCIEW